ncbi:unnamed protein product [Rotaria magnacalcarata]|uniref:Uncharacterized protein n=1 Tax=Rotaria magnacalcarata TaxID=392030 RepID=A0A819NLY6_9BILA|nr:unnamed protein product [Rotaria magnacalcarata]
MLSTLITFGFLIIFSSSASTDSDDIWKVEIGTSSMGRIKYEDGEVVLYQNRLKPTDIFFTPFPRVDPTTSNCLENILSGYIELNLSVELYTSRLVHAVKSYLKQYFSELCAKNVTCDVSLLPMSAVRLVQKGLRTSKTRELYTIDDEWHSNTLLLQAIDFVIYTTNQTACERLRSSIVERCYLSNFEIHYTLHSEKTVERQVEISTEQVTSTDMFNKIHSRFSQSDTVALTGGDFKQLINEVTDKVTMKLRVQEGFDAKIQDPIDLGKLIERQLQFKQVHLEKMNDQVWESLYWTHEQTRPDALAKVVNTIIRKNSTDGKQFIYDSQAAKNAQKLHLTQHDIDKFDQLDKFLGTYAHSTASSNSHESSSKGGLSFGFKGFKLGSSRSGNSQSESQISENLNTVTDAMHNLKTDKDHLNSIKTDVLNDTQHTLTRDDVEAYLSELSDHIQIEGELIRPKPIDVHLVKLSILRVATKLLSHSILVRTRTIVHVLPLRCPSAEKTIAADNITTKYDWLVDDVGELKETIKNLTNQLDQARQQMLSHTAKIDNWTKNTNEFKSQMEEFQKEITEKQRYMSSKIFNLSQPASYIINITRLENQIKKLQNTTGQQYSTLQNQVTVLQGTIGSTADADLARITISLPTISSKLKWDFAQNTNLEQHNSEAVPFAKMEEKFNQVKNDLTHIRVRTVYACRVCFQETEGSSQCQGNRNSCSGWSTSPQWTAHYRDDTDGRAGGCAYFWKIECLTGV